MPYQVHQDTILWESNIQRRSTIDPKNLHALTKKNYNLFRYNELPGKLLPSDAEVCQPLRKLTSSKCKWTSNKTCQNLSDRAKNVIKKNAIIAFYNEEEQLNLEPVVSDIGQGASLLQVWDRMWFPKKDAPDHAVLWPMAFGSKSLTNTET